MDREKINKLLKLTGANNPADSFARLLDEYFYKHNIKDEDEICRFLANVYCESVKFNRFEENLNYKTMKALKNGLGLEDPSLLNNPPKLAEAAYGYQTKRGKMLGNTEPGDGWKYRGRGAMQTTGKWNYQDLTNKTGIDFVKDPDKLKYPEYAIESAVIFWKVKECGQITDLKALRKKINGGYNGLEEMIENYHKLKEAVRKL